jgi:hypothetical protein
MHHLFIRFLTSRKLTCLVQIRLPKTSFVFNYQNHLNDFTALDWNDDQSQ